MFSVLRAKRALLGCNCFLAFHRKMSPSTKLGPHDNKQGVWFLRGLKKTSFYKDLVQANKKVMGWYRSNILFRTEYAQQAKQQAQFPGPRVPSLHPRRRMILSFPSAVLLAFPDDFDKQLALWIHPLPGIKQPENFPTLTKAAFCLLPTKNAVKPEQSRLHAMQTLPWVQQNGKNLQRSSTGPMGRWEFGFLPLLSPSMRLLYP